MSTCEHPSRSPLFRYVQVQRVVAPAPCPAAKLRVEQRAEESRWGSLPGEDAAGGDGLLSEEFVEEMRLQLDAISADYAKVRGAAVGG